MHLSGATTLIAAVASYEILMGPEIFPDITGSILAAIIIGVSLGYAFAILKGRKGAFLRKTIENVDSKPFLS